MTKYYKFRFGGNLGSLVIVVGGKNVLEVVTKIHTKYEQLLPPGQQAKDMIFKLVGIGPSRKELLAYKN